MNDTQRPARLPKNRISSARSSARTWPRAGTTSIRTRFPPEPNGYLHIGHAKSICLNFGVAARVRRRAATCASTTPTRRKEDLEYVEAIKDDVHWLGFEYAELRHASDYFEVFYRSALKLIEDGKAYVCDLSAEEVREYRGTLTQPGRNSPFRERPVAENLDLFRRMRAGEFPDGARTLRAKIDMASGNINLRDPAIYRIRHVAAPEHRRRLADLSDVRLRALHLRRGRGHHPFAVHAGVRGPPPAVRLVHRQHRPARESRRCGSRWSTAGLATPV